MAETKPKTIILDTDIGPDCDDVGALLMLLKLEKAGLCRIAAITHCTSNPFGCGCIDAICRAEGRSDMPIGTLKRDGILCGFDDARYNEVICGLYENRFANGADAPDAVKVLRRAFAENEDITLVTIGPLGNVADFLKSGPDEISPKTGLELARESCSRMVCMGGNMDGDCREFNFFVETDATATVLALWPTEIFLSILSTGNDVQTGADMSSRLGRLHPAALAFALHSPNGRSSFDETAVYYALFPETPLFETSRAGWMGILANGANTWRFAEDGRHYYFVKACPPEQVAEALESWMYR